MAQRYALFCIVVLFSNCVADTERVFVHGKKRRELPLSSDCNPFAGSCSKGDLIAKRIADCERYARWFRFFTCDPINDYLFSSVVDVPDVSKHKIDCIATSNLPITCGATTDTRCVCDKAVDFHRLRETFANRCRCQYWPAMDIRADQPSYCTQYDHGGISGVHFYTCCNNCNDDNGSCDGYTYQGGGATKDYCSTCGQNSESGGGRITYRFNCVNCAQQALCDRTCSTGFFAFTKHIPGLCHAWTRCFRLCCIAAANSRQVKAAYISGTDEKYEFCGDFVCQNGEDHITCPTDCCPHYNPNGCGLLLFGPDCCYEPGCCV